jgi:hypothetical protein
MQKVFKKKLKTTRNKALVKNANLSATMVNMVLE